MTLPLRIAVLIKQVPLIDTMSEPLKLGGDGRLVRQGIELEIDPFCRRAITQGVEMASSSGGRCSVYTLGPPSAEDALLEALAAGANDAVLLTDPAFAGSDTLATARALAACLCREGPFDLVLAGLHSVDADTGQVGPEVAELLGLPFVAGVRELVLQARSLSLLCERDDGMVQAEVGLPAVLSVAERLTYPAKRGPAEQAQVDRARVRRMGPAELGFGPYGETGSPTAVGEVRLTRMLRRGRRLEGSLDDCLDVLIGDLLERGALSALSTPTEAGRVPSTMGPPAVVVALEPARPRLARELLGAAASLAHQLGGSVVAAQPMVQPATLESSALADQAEASGSALSRPERVTSATDLSAWGADLVVELTASNGGTLDAEDVASGLGRCLEAEQPTIFLSPSTSFGREVAARFAARNQAGLTGDATSLELADGRLVAWKPAFGGELEAAITASSAIQCATVRPGALPLLKARETSAPVRTLAVQPGGRVAYGTRTIDWAARTLAAAPALVGVGAGVDPGCYGDLDPLLKVLDSQLVATRKVTDQGWLPRTRQVGLTGIHVGPGLYVAIGISGRTNHMVGLRRAGTIVAINCDPGATIFEMADYGLLGDWREVVPPLTQRLRAVLMEVPSPRAPHEHYPQGLGAP